MRTARLDRKTKETQIQVTLTLDGSGKHDIETGIGFFDHLMRHVAVHGLFDLTVKARGDLEIDAHHTVEDVALVFGACLDKALGDRAGLTRMGQAIVPMDESLVLVAVDLSGRPYSVVRADWNAPAIGQMPTALAAHFLKSFAVAGRLNLHARVLAGQDDHHQAEALFKALGRALEMAVHIDKRRKNQIPSTKGTLT